MKIYERICWSCGEKIVYKSSSSYCVAKKRNYRCKPCGTKAQSGENNYFYGCRHSEETKQKIKEKRAKQVFSEETRAKLREHAIESGFNKVNWYQIWVEKYGEKVAREKLAEKSEANSKRMKGKGNPWYGKPAPQGSGNGWSGWYHGWYFRSIAELTFAVVHLDRNGVVWKNGEKAGLNIPYINPLGNERTYRPDFLVGDIVYECKPRRLWKSPAVMCKTKAAIQYCKERGLRYRLVDVKKMDILDVKDLWESKEIVFLERYEEKFIKLLEKKGLLEPAEAI